MEYSKTIRKAIIWYSIQNRRKKAQMIEAFAERRGCRTVILMGAIGINDRRPNESIVEELLTDRLDVVSALNITPSVSPWPFVVGDGRSMPYRGRAVDLVVSNAVIEHVGDRVDQLRFVAEHSRVGSSWAITTPNRWFPIESHTSSVLLHWSRRWRIGRDEFTRLLSRKEFRDLLPPGTVVIGSPFSPTFIAFGENS